MKKRDLKIINFLYLSDEKLKKIREYRNQEYVRDVSISKNIISENEHKNYLTLLEKKDKYFAFLVLNEEKDYGVITFNKIDDKIYYIGDYLVKEEYKFEGGGIANRFCINILCNRLNIKFLKAKQQIDNTRGNRGGGVFTLEHTSCKDGFNEYLVEVPSFDDERISNTKAKKMFDKLYTIKEVKI